MEHLVWFEGQWWLPVVYVPQQPPEEKPLVEKNNSTNKILLFKSDSLILPQILMRDFEPCMYHVKLFLLKNEQRKVCVLSTKLKSYAKKNSNETVIPSQNIKFNEAMKRECFTSCRNMPGRRLFELEISLNKIPLFCSRYFLRTKKSLQRNSNKITRVYKTVFTSDVNGKRKQLKS